MAFNAADGSLVWRHETDGLVFGAPIVVGDVLYVGSSYMGPIPTDLTPDAFQVVFTGLRGTVYALNKADGNEIWSYPTGGAMYSSPAMANGVLYIGSMDSHVYAFGTAATQPGLNIPLTYIIAAIAAIIIAAIVVALLLRRKKK